MKKEKEKRDKSLLKKGSENVMKMKRRERSRERNQERGQERGQERKEMRNSSDLSDDEKSVAPSITNDDSVEMINGNTIDLRIDTRILSNDVQG